MYGRQEQDDPRNRRPGESLQEYGQRRSAELEGEKQEKAEAQRKVIAEASAKLAAEREAKEAETKRKQAEYLAEQQRLTNERLARQEQMAKLTARMHYTGTDESFEQDWPTIRAAQMAESIKAGQQADRLRYTRDF